MPTGGLAPLGLWDRTGRWKEVWMRTPVRVVLVLVASCDSGHQVLEAHLSVSQGDQPSPE
jgi:hypothetical protein